MTQMSGQPKYKFSEILILIVFASIASFMLGKGVGKSERWDELHECKLDLMIEVETNK